jgi:hypothetical protein
MNLAAVRSGSSSPVGINRLRDGGGEQLHGGLQLGLGAVFELA